MMMDEFNLAEIPEDVAAEIRKYHSARNEDVTMIGIWPLNGAYSYDGFLAEVSMSNHHTHYVVLHMIDYNSNKTVEMARYGLQMWKSMIEGALATCEKLGIRHPNALTAEQRRKAESNNAQHPYLHRQWLWQTIGPQNVEGA